MNDKLSAATLFGGETLGFRHFYWRGTPITFTDNSLMPSVQ